MTIKQAIKVLEAHNIWRRGENEDGMVCPNKLGAAIDTIVKYHKKIAKLKLEIKKHNKEAELIDSFTYSC